MIDGSGSSIGIDSIISKCCLVYVGVKFDSIVEASSVGVYLVVLDGGALE